MTFNPVFFILSEANFLPADEAQSWLGKVVSHYSAPHYGSVPKDALVTSWEKIRVRELKNVEKVIQASRGTSYEPQLQGVLRACAKKQDDVAFNFKTARMRIMQLQDHEEVFARFLQMSMLDKSVDERIRAWSKPLGEPLYMVVGLMIWTDPEFNSKSSTSRERNVEVTAPVNAALNIATATQIGVPVVPQGVGDVSLGVGRSKSVQSTMSASQHGDAIFAVEYRVIRRLKHTAFTRFGLDAQLPRFVGQRTMSEQGKGADGSELEEDEEKAERLRLENNDVPWTESLEEDDDAKSIEVERMAGVSIGLSFASEVGGE